MDTTAMTLPARYTDLTYGGEPVLGRSGVERFKPGWTNDKPVAPNARGSDPDHSVSPPSTGGAEPSHDEARTGPAAPR
ncbi:hypothetical protein ABZT47_09390 [Sphaerisporangium sp. NPDC005289]|uniref:hypothetical protein n=1 Tax=Sphaerisporangium sp. NPDC005289 TaxID=3155247 RepID=UPI0033A2D853